MQSLPTFSPEATGDRAPWTIRDTVTGTLLTLVPLVLLSVISLLSSGAGNAATPKLSPAVDAVTAIFVFVISAALEVVFIIAPIYYARKRAGTAAAPALGLRPFHVGLALGLIILCFAGTIVASYLYTAIANALNFNVQTNVDPLLKQLQSEPLTVYATLIVAVVVAPFCEELFFRGFLLKGLQHVMSTPWAVIVSSLVFAAAHVSPGSFPLLLVLALFLGTLRVVTRSLWPGVILHTLNNALVLVLFLPIPGIK